jgi:uncharacterized protein (TIGR02145 family)
MKKINFLVMLLLVATVSAQAQVTIGGVKIPESFSILELISGSSGDDDRGGMRLPQLTMEDRKYISDHYGSEEEMQGVQIFNIDTQCVETWNGSEWIQECLNDTPAPPYALGEVAHRANTNAATPLTKLKFATYNLGAEQLSIKDQLLHDCPTSEITAGNSSERQAGYAKVYGSLYQWGRKSDGHQSVSSSLSSTPYSDPFNTGSNFITTTNWTSVSNNDLWLVNSGNNPCLSFGSGWHVPSRDEWAGIGNGIGSSLSGMSVTNKIFYGVNKWVWVDGTQTLDQLGVDSENNDVPKTKGYLIYPPAWTYNFTDNGYDDDDYLTTPTLFLPAGGYRYYGNGAVTSISGTCGFWSSTPNGDAAYYIASTSTNVLSQTSFARTDGFPLRCLSE